MKKHTTYLFITFLCFLFSSAIAWGAVLYDKHSYKQAVEFSKTFTATGQVHVTSPSKRSAGTGTLIIVGGRPAVLTAAHVIEEEAHVSMVLDTPTGELTISLSQDDKHIYPLYTQLKDKCFDVGIIFLEEGHYTFSNKELKIHRLFQDSVSVDYMTILPSEYDQAEMCLASFAGYGTPGTFNDKGHVFYEQDSPQKIASQVRLIPKKNILYEHGCGYDMDLDISSNDIKQISQTHFFWDRVQKKNNPREFPGTVKGVGAFSPGDSGGPVIYEGRIIGVVSTAELPLIKQSAKRFYQFIPKASREKWIGWDDGFAEGSFGQKMLRRFAKYYFEIPDSTVNLFQTATAITPTIYRWMEEKARNFTPEK